MDNFDEYLRQSEPNKENKAKIWKTAIGLQEVDGLKPSDYLITAAKQNIEGDITIDEVKHLMDSYYKQNPQKNPEHRTEEADKVSARIVEMLSEETFSFSPVEYLSIHQRLFEGLYDHAGKIRDYNITKKEWVLNNETVLYASAQSLNATLRYDFEEEKKFSFKGLNQQEIVEHIAYFISNLWQIHIFCEGNTRTTAVFLIKYLRKLGFKAVNNDLFAKYSWYFRNALVRANYENLSKGIYKTEQYLIDFLSNLVLNTNYALINRKMHIEYINTINAINDTIKEANDTINAINDTIKEANDTINDSIFSLIKGNNKISASQISVKLNISVSTVRRKIKALKDSGKIARLGSNKTGEWKIIV